MDRIYSYITHTHTYALSFSCCYSSANAAPEFEGRGGEELASDITSVLTRAYADSNTLDMQSLCVAEGQHCWILYIDILVCLI